MVSCKIWMAAFALIIVLVFQSSIIKQMFRLSTPPVSTLASLSSKEPLGSTTTIRSMEETLHQCRELFTEAALNLSHPHAPSLRPLVATTNDFSESISNETATASSATSTIANASSVVPNPDLFCSSQVLGEKQKWNHYKKVISYAIFGPNNNNNNDPNATTMIPDWVIHGIEKNMFDAKLYFPDWIVRVYTFEVPPSLQDKWLIHNASLFHNVELVRCFSDTLMAKSTSRKMLSRFLAHDDPKVWYTLVRDADSRLSLREVMAVNEFIEASMATDNLVDASETHPLLQVEQTPPPIYFHAMRDHEKHKIPIMGGMFGMKRGLFKSAIPNGNLTMTGLLDQALQEHPDILGSLKGCCGEDQQFLQDYVWPHVHRVALSHDIDRRRCNRFRARLCRGFPLGPRDESINYFVGSQFKMKNKKQEWQTMHKEHTCTLQCKWTDENK